MRVDGVRGIEPLRLSRVVGLSVSQLRYADVSGICDISRVRTFKVAVVTNTPTFHPETRGFLCFGKMGTLALLGGENS